MSDHEYLTQPEYGSADDRPAHRLFVPLLPPPVELQLSAGLIEPLFAAHGHMAFAHGVVSADPHLGNVLLDEPSGALSLIDAAQLYERS